MSMFCYTALVYVGLGLCKDYQYLTIKAIKIKICTHFPFNVYGTALLHFINALSLSFFILLCELV
jgi:hypothetical protein